MDIKVVIKYCIVIGSLPWVLPFVKSLIRDLLQSIELDGGLWGSPPAGESLERLKRERALREDPLVSEPLAHVRANLDARDEG